MLTSKWLFVPEIITISSKNQRAYSKYWHTSGRFWVLYFQWFYEFWILVMGFGVFANQPNVHNGGVNKGRVCGCGCWMLVTSDRWQVTRNTLHVKHDTWHITSDTWHLTCDTIPPPLSVSVRFGIGGNIRTRQEIQHPRMRYFLAID